MNTNILQYAYLFNYPDKKQVRKEISGQDPISGICGRVLRGKQENDFLTLTDDPNRKIVMPMEATGLNELLGLTGYEILEIIGYTHEQIERKVKEGNKFKLLILLERTLNPATWENVVEIVSQAYPDIAEDFRRNAFDLACSSFNKIEKMKANKTFAEIDAIGSNDPDYMTYERFLKSDRGLYACRAFLYFTVHLRELYSGDGYTYTPQGVKGVKEFIMLNMPISNLGENLLLDFDVRLP